MSDSFVSYLSDQRVDFATLQHAVRYVVAELTDDATPRELERIKQACLEDASVAHQLEQDAEFLNAASIAVLQAAWEDERTRDVVERAIAGAKSKLPVVEVGLVVAGVVTMYSYYLRVTGGRSRSATVLRRHPDGTFEVAEVTEWASPVGPLSALTSAIAPSAPVDPASLESFATELLSSPEASPEGHASSAEPSAP